MDPYVSITYRDALDDVHTRFILNLPESELQTADRIFFQLEQAWWFYEDMICDPHPTNHHQLPRYATLKPFARVLFDYSPRLPNADTHFNDMWQQYILYKRKISNYGCILLNTSRTKIVLCQVYNGKNYTLPSGKINQGEDGASAAARETYEETGFDPTCKMGLTHTWQDTSPHRITWNTSLLESDLLSHQEDNNNNNNNRGGGGKVRNCYIVSGVPEDFPFAPVCRKEVSTVEWFPIDNLPTTTFAVLPFMKQLRKWIHRNNSNKTTTKVTASAVDSIPTPGTTSSGHKSRDKSNSKSRDTSRSKASKGGGGDTSNHDSSKRRQGSRGRNRRNDSRGRDRDTIQNESNDLILSGLASSVGESSGWSEDEMFATNERLLCRKIEYDGNPHVFVEEGLAKTDPHAFRIVGGTFLNSNHSTTDGGRRPSIDDDGGIMGLLAPPPDKSRLQPIFRPTSEHTSTVSSSSVVVEGLTPFFTEDGATPWGEVILEAKSDPKLLLSPAAKSTMVATSTTKAARKVKSVAELKQQQQVEPPPPNVPHGQSTLDIHDYFLPTDAQITAQSQAIKSKLLMSDVAAPMRPRQSELSLSSAAQYKRDMEQINQWVSNLPKSFIPTRSLGLFQIDRTAVEANIQKAQQQYQRRLEVVVETSDTAQKRDDDYVRQWMQQRFPRPQQLPTQRFGIVLHNLDAETVLSNAEHAVLAKSIGSAA